MDPDFCEFCSGTADRLDETTRQRMTEALTASEGMSPDEWSKMFD